MNAAVALTLQLPLLLPLLPRVCHAEKVLAAAAMAAAVRPPPGHHHHRHHHHHHNRHQQQQEHEQRDLLALLQEIDPSRG